MIANMSRYVCFKFLWKTFVIYIYNENEKINLFLENVQIVTYELIRYIMVENCFYTVVFCIQSTRMKNTVFIFMKFYIYLQYLK